MNPPPQVDATLEGIAEELREITLHKLCEFPATSARMHQIINTLSAHARKSQPVNERHAAHALAMLALQSERYGNDPDYRDATDNVLAWTMNAAESAAPGENEQVKGFANAIRSIISEQPCDNGGRGGCSTISRLEDLMTVHAARKTEGAK